MFNLRNLAQNRRPNSSTCCVHRLIRCARRLCEQDILWSYLEFKRNSRVRVIEMAESSGSATKPSIFGKMFSIIKNVTEMALDTQPGYTSDDCLSDTDNNAAGEESEDDEPVTLDFLTKYDVGSSVRNNLTADVAAAIHSVPETADLLDFGGSTEDLLDPDLLALDANLGDLLTDDAFGGADLFGKDSTTDPEHLSSSSSTSDLPVNSEGVSEGAAAGSAEAKTSKGGYASSGVAGTFHTRVGPNYKANKQKAPSAPALLELMSVDFVRTPCRVPDVGRFLNIPEEWSAGIDTHHPGIPPLFIVQAQIPDKWPTTVFVETTDGPCYSFILVYRVTQETAAAMKDLNSACPTVQLFAQYCLENYQHSASGAADNSSTAGDSSNGNGSTSNASFVVKGDNWVSRSKVFVRCDNISELKLPKFLHAYNAKPALIRESGTMIRGNNYLELDVNIKKFGLLANKTLPVLLARLHLMQLSIAICIESRDEDELPEGILGCVGVHNLSASAKDVPMWFVKRK